MPQAMTDIASIVEQLNERILTLETRVAVLEGQPPKVVAAPSPAKPAQPRPPETWQGFPPLELPSVVSTLGKAVLGIAGAYLFRALAESGAVPKWPVLALAIVYAALWMVRAVKISAQGFASITYALTSILILSPMLWETTVRFQFLSPAFTGGILVAFFLLTLVLTWKRDLKAIPWITAAATMATALGLILATRDLAPLTLSILSVALIVETASCFHHFTSSRIVPAMAANFAVLLVVYIMTAGPAPEGYVPVSPATVVVLWFTLLAIYFGSIGIRGFWLLRDITILDIVQGTLAFAIAAFAASRAPASFSALALGIILLALAVGCYWGALSRFAGSESSRSHRISSCWAAALLVAGSVFTFPSTASVIFLCAAAVVTAVLYTKSASISLGLHASIFLAAGFAFSSLPNFISGALAGSVPTRFSADVLVTSLAALFCYLVSSSVAENTIRKRTLWVFPAGLIAFAAAAATITTIVWFTIGHREISASLLSVVRTIVNCVLALTLAFLGLHWRRIELGWVAYASVGFGTLKIVFEDLRFGNATTLVFSLLFYGVVLIVLPRLTSHGRTDYLNPRKYFAHAAN